jgi:hypothetical protein
MNEHSIDFKVVWMQANQFAARAEKIHTTPVNTMVGWSDARRDGRKNKNKSTAAP